MSTDTDKRTDAQRLGQIKDTLWSEHHSARFDRNLEHVSVSSTAMWAKQYNWKQVNFNIALLLCWQTEEESMWLALAPRRVPLIGRSGPRSDHPLVEKLHVWGDWTASGCGIILNRGLGNLLHCICDPLYAQYTRCNTWHASYLPPLPINNS